MALTTASPRRHPASRRLPETPSGWAFSKDAARLPGAVQQSFFANSRLVDPAGSATSADAPATPPCGLPVRVARSCPRRLFHPRYGLYQVQPSARPAAIRPARETRPPHLFHNGSSLPLSYRPFAIVVFIVSAGRSASAALPVRRSALPLSDL